MKSLIAHLTFYLLTGIIIVSGSVSGSEESFGFCALCDNKCSFGPTFYDFVIEEKEIAPDNFKQKGKVINGQFPGPTITTSPHQTLVIRVTNRLSKNAITIHFHGLHQQRTLSSDGVGMITQDDIPVNGSYTYCIEIDDQMGTFFYHAHTGFDNYWVYGALIIEDSSFLREMGVGLGRHFGASELYSNYDEERIILLGHLYHMSVDTMLDQLLYTGRGNRGNMSILINGKSYGDWPPQNAASASPGGYDVLSVEKGKTYRFRVINASASRLLRFSIQGHKMTVIEADGIFVEPKEVDSLLIHVAQRYSVIVKTTLPEDNYWVTGESASSPGPGNGAAILHYKGAPDPTPLTTLIRPNTAATPLTFQHFFPSKVIRQKVLYKVPKKIHRNIYLEFHKISIPPVERYAIGGNIFQHPKDHSYISQVMERKINITKEPEVFEVIMGQGVQAIFQNTMEDGGSCTPHPWHFHGRHFYIVAYGSDKFVEERDLPKIDAIVKHKGKTDFEFRDVFMQIPSQSVVNLTAGAPCGWQAVRFLANNPGIWLAHCHITDHMLEGKMFVIWEHTKANPWLCGE